MLKKASIIFYILILVGICYFLFTFFNNRHTTDKTTEIINESSTSADATTPQPPSDEVTTELTEEKMTISDSPKNTEKSKNNITQLDCKNECMSFASASDIDYCKQVCGLSTPLPFTEPCSEQVGLEKDYCLRSEAFAQKSFEKCREITDKNIAQQCENRLTEDIIDATE